jgi:hypothetical protein
LRNQTTLPSTPPRRSGRLAVAVPVGDDRGCVAVLNPDRLPAGDEWLPDRRTPASPPVPTFRTKNTSPLTVPTIKSRLAVAVPVEMRTADAEPTLSGLPPAVFSCSPAAKRPSSSRRKK